MPDTTATNRGAEHQNFLRLAGNCELPLQYREVPRETVLVDAPQRLAELHAKPVPVWRYLEK